MKINRFTDLTVWQEAHKLTLLIYKITDKFPSSKIYGLTSQLKRAAVSVESCIAEGFCRYHYKDRLNFYYDARGSVGEIQSEILDAKDIGFIGNKDFNEVINQSEQVGLILNGLIRSTINLSKK